MRGMSRHHVRHSCVVLVLTAFAGCAPAAPPAAPAERFEAFVDAFLDHFASHHPSIAAGNGLHQYDDRLEDFSAPAVNAEIDAWKALRARLAAIPVDGLTPDERVDHRIVAGLIDAWLLDLEGNRTWQKNLMVYASAISDGVHNLMTMESAPAEVRAARIVAKLRGVAPLLAAARANITDPPKVMAERGVRMLKGASGMLTADVPLADRCVKRGARVLGPTGRPFTESSIGSDLAMRNLMTGLREAGEIRGSGRPFTKQDRSRFLGALDTAIQAIRRTGR